MNRRLRLRGLQHDEGAFEPHVLNATDGKGNASMGDMDGEASAIGDGVRAVFDVDFEGLEDVLELG